MAFKGGYTFSRFEGVAEPTVIETDVPGVVTLPLMTASGITLKPVAGEGVSVKAGEPVLKADDGSSASLPSPVNGKITAVGETSITIESDGTSSVTPVPGHTREPWSLDSGALFELFNTSGCSLLLENTYASPDECGKVTAIVINAVHNGPLDQKWVPGMYGDPELLAAGLKTLKALFSNAKIVIAVNKRNRRSYDSSELGGLADVKVVSDKYPQEHPALLVRDTFSRKLESVDCERDHTALVLSYGDMVQIAEAMTRGKAPVDRLLMIAGPGVSKPAWYRVRIGTSIGDLKQSLFKADEFGPWRIIRGSVMTGAGLDSPDVPVTAHDSEISVISDKTDRALFGFLMPGFSGDSYSKSTAAEYIPVLPKKLETNVHGGVRPCVQCNFCDEVCPVGIYPFLIWKYVKADKVEESFRLRPFDCIECGLCNYVCPSKIDVVSGVKQAKNEYCEQRRADASAD